MLAESQNDSKNDPLVIWFNGGPGCSSLLGFFQENGPVRVDPEINPTHQVNEYSWNKNANMLYIESPAGVGFSIWTDEDKTTNDTIQSADAIAAVHFFFTQFPEYKTNNNELFVSGESYGGIYVPYLAWEIFTFNNKTETAEEDKINLKGFLVGNGATNWDFDSTPSFPNTTYNFQLIPRHLLDFMQDNNCTYYLNDFRPHSGPDTCDAVWNKI
jgi:carboxypeptidase C (cathepsin A)